MMNDPSPNEEKRERTKERIQFDFTPEALRRMDEMKERTGATTKAEVVRNSLRVFDWLTGLNQDWSVKVFDETGQMVHSVPIRLLVAKPD